MALVTCNGIAVISGQVERPLTGVWTADLVLDQPDGSGFSPGTKVTLAADNGYTLNGVVDPHRTGDFLDAVHVRILGGAGGMGNTSTARNLVQPGAFVRDVLNALAIDSGESLSSTVDAGFLSSNLTAWSVIGGNPVSQNLRALLNIVEPGFNWRILADGTLWMGSESWPRASGTYEVMTQNPADGSYEIGVDSPFVVPGTNLANVGHVSRVLDTITAGRLRSRIWVELPSEGDRGIAPGIQRIVKQALAGIDYYGFYVCEVVAQSADMTTVDLQPQGSRNNSLLGGLQRIPLRLAPGIQVKFSPGATVLLGWDGGSPTNPFACLGVPGDTALKVGVQATQVQIQATADLSMSGATVNVSATGAASFKGSSTTQLGNVGTFPVLTSPNAIDCMGVPVSLLVPTTVLAG